MFLKVQVFAMSACLLATAAAADATTPTTVIVAQPFVDFVSCVLNPAIGSIVAIILGLLFAEIKAFTGRSFSAGVQAQVTAWATTEVQVMAAAIEGNLGSRAFTVKSPEVAAIVNAAPFFITKLLTDLGWSTDDLARLVVAAIGAEQQKTPVVVAAAPAVPVIQAPASSS